MLTFTLHGSDSKDNSIELWMCSVHVETINSWGTLLRLLGGSVVVAQASNC